MWTYKYNTVHFNYIYISVSKFSFPLLYTWKCESAIQTFFSSRFHVLSDPLISHMFSNPSHFSQFNKMGEKFSKKLVVLFLLVEPLCSLLKLRISTTSWTLIGVLFCHSSPYLGSYVISSFINNAAWNLTLVLLLSFRSKMLFTDTHPSILKWIFKK